MATSEKAGKLLDFKTENTRSRAKFDQEINKI